jgi:hypothetical protein
MILELVNQGRLCLERGELAEAKTYCRQIALYLDSYLVSDEDWAKIEVFLKEVLLIQKVAEWKAAGRKEYQLLEEAAKAEIHSSEQALDLENLENFL